MRFKGKTSLDISHKTWPKSGSNVGRCHATKDIDLFIFHQASKVVLEKLRKTLNIPADKIFNNYNEIGNTVSASIPIALKEAENRGKLIKDYDVMLVGFGVGYSWGSCIIKWT